MSNTQWFCAINGKQEGPYTVEALASMTAQSPLAPDTMVWSEGMPGWKHLSETPLYNALPKSMVPPAVPLGAVFQAGAQNTASLGFVDAVKICLTKYADFKGRASRPEYWWFALFSFMLAFVAAFIPAFFSAFGPTPFTAFLSLINLLISLALILPSIAVAVRRLHDIDRTGWWILIGLVPLVGLIAMLVFLTKPGTAGQNRFG